MGAGLIMSFGLLHGLDNALLQDDFDFDAICGPDGSALIEAGRTFDYETMHDFLTQQLNADVLNYAGSSMFALVVHYGL
eukprot:COSAG06_NODE_26084_length_622_cov_0.764818_1_plen_78_part_10